MDILVDDCLLHIFKFVDLKDWLILCEVCQRWKRLISRMWRKSIVMKIEMVKEDTPKITREDVLRVARYFAPMIHRLELHPEGSNTVISFGDAYKYVLDDEYQRQSLTNDLLRVLSECAFNIQYLYLRMVAVDWMFITTLLIYNKGLKSFKAFILYEELTDYLPDTLETVKWFHSNNLNEKFTGFMRRECKLKKLHMFSNNGATSDLALQSVSENPIQLESLCLLTYPSERNDGSLMSLYCLSNFIYLKKLHLTGPQIYLSDQEVVNIVSRCVQLEQVKLCFLSSSNKAMNHLMTLPRLRKLKFHHVKNLSQLKPVGTMVHLKTLSFRADVESSFDYNCIVSMLHKTPQLSKLIFPRELYLPIRVLCDIVSLIAHRPQQVLLEPTEDYFADYLQIAFNNRYYMSLYEKSSSNSFMLILEPDLMNLLVSDLGNNSVRLRAIVYSMTNNEKKSCNRQESLADEESFSDEEESETDEEG